MLKNFVKNSFWIAIAFCCATQMSHAQGVDPTPQNPFPASSALLNIGPDADGHLTMGGEYKQAKNVVEQEKPVFWTWFVDAGYMSEYNFRGTNLTPDAGGAGFFDAQVTKWNFTLGLFGVHQFGHASVDAWSMGESGGSGGTRGTGADSGGIPYLRFPTTVQTRFDELDVFLSYKFSLGPIDVTLGNIAFFISRNATTSELDLAPPGFFWIVPFTARRTRVLGTAKYPPPDPTVEEETFDRLYIRLSTTKISKYITPQITYYQTVYSWGAEPTQGGTMFYNPVPVPFPPFVRRPSNPRPFNERNEALGGYLEGRINGHVPLAKWVDFNPHAILSVSFRDRVEPGGSWPYGSHPYTGFNHVQAGAELPIHLVHLGGFSSSQWAPPDADVFFVPFGDYAYHIGRPTAGTSRNEWWGGGKFEVTF